MAEAYIVAAARTAGGRKGGRLAGWHPADLAATVLNALVERSGAAPDQIEDVMSAPDRLARAKLTPCASHERSRAYLEREAQRAGDPSLLERIRGSIEAGISKSARISRSHSSVARFISCVRLAFDTSVT